MLMKIKSVSKSTPKFFTKQSNLSQPRLFFNDSKQSKPNLMTKKVHKLTNYKNKENSFNDSTELFSKQQCTSRRMNIQNQSIQDNSFQREKRKRQFRFMCDKVRLLEDKMNRVKMILDKHQKKKNGTKINKQGKINSISKQTISSINSFVTQMKIPLQLAPHCSSQSNLLSVKQPLKIKNHKYYVSTVVTAFNSRANTTFMQLCKTHLTTSLQLLKVLKNAEKPKEVKPVKQLQPTTKNTIIFDLDETLIHCNQNTNIPYDVLLQLNFPGGEIVKAGINVRAKAIQTLKILAKHFEIIVFTASHQCYGSVVCDYLDPNNQYIAQRYYRDSCFKSKQGYYIKDLRVIDRPLQKMLLIDNAAYSYAFQVQNGVPIIPFYECKTDLQLKHLTQYLIPFANSNDMRIEHCNQMKHPVDLINQLYGDISTK